MRREDYLTAAAQVDSSIQSVATERRDRSWSASARWLHSVHQPRPSRHCG